MFAFLHKLLIKRGDSMAIAHKTAISVGLLYIPVGLYKTTRDISITFKQLCKNSHERVKYKKYCPSCDKEIKNEDIIKGIRDDKLPKECKIGEQ